MANYDEHSNSNSIILRLMERILAMNDEQRLDLLSKLEDNPVAPNPENVDQRSANDPKYE